MGHDNHESRACTSDTVLAELNELVERSSLGTPEAVESRSRTPEWQVKRVTERCAMFARRGKYLAGAEFDEADLRDADLREADLRDATLRGADLHHADLSGADLSGAQLQEADLRHADLSGADLSGAQLDHADLGNANLDGAMLMGASLTWADLTGANLDGAALTDAALDGARLIGVTMHDASLYRSSLRNAAIRQADLTGTYLAEARLDDAVVMDSILQGRELTGTTFRGTRIGRVDLTSCPGLVPAQLDESLVRADTVLPGEWAADPRQSPGLDIVTPAALARAVEWWQIAGLSMPTRRHRLDDHAGWLELAPGVKPRVLSGHDTRRKTVVPAEYPPPAAPARSPSSRPHKAARPHKPTARHTRRTRRPGKGRHRAVSQTTGARLGRAAHILPVLAAIVAAFMRILGGVQPAPHPDIQPTMTENSSFDHEMSLT